jgi:hypothetical protein
MPETIYIHREIDMPETIYINELPLPASLVSAIEHPFPRRLNPHT